MSQELVETIKQIAVKAVESQKPTAVRFGTVMIGSPLQVKLSQKEIYSKEFFIALDGTRVYDPGDTLVLLQLQGGQQFLILGKKGVVP